jgi:hypothetical protein
MKKKVIGNENENENEKKVKKRVLFEPFQVLINIIALSFRFFYRQSSP